MWHWVFKYKTLKNYVKIIIFLLKGSHELNPIYPGVKVFLISNAQNG